MNTQGYKWELHVQPFKKLLIHGPPVRAAYWVKIFVTNLIPYFLCWKERNDPHQLHIIIVV